MCYKPETTGQVSGVPEFFFHTVTFHPFSVPFFGLQQLVTQNAKMAESVSDLENAGANRAMEEDTVIKFCNALQRQYNIQYQTRRITLLCGSFVFSNLSPGVSERGSLFSSRNLQLCHRLGWRGLSCSSSFIIWKLHPFCIVFQHSVDSLVTTEANVLLQMCAGADHHILVYIVQRRSSNEIALPEDELPF
ncbi:hypothetical protein lerEdw1_020367 [Lerista edwardsae]|nr:hypothetical protein lerEdw1_020367 [Lerista edwardsae]